MKTIHYLFGIMLALMLSLVSCDSGPSLQKYFVEKAKSQDFIAFDLGTSIIKGDKFDLSQKQTKALDAVKKLNILIFKSGNENDQLYTAEAKNVKGLLKTGGYEELMRFGSGKSGGSISMLGENDDIDEFVIYLHQNGDSFGLIRVLGDDMTPSDVFTVVQLIQKSGLDIAQLQPALNAMNINNNEG